ncbi:MAG: hypothetical protein HY547_02915 [Elusimicrobia bacterium]|nr:hypothetical protein [Elusimicrobiota bacterium]
MNIGIIGPGAAGLYLLARIIESAKLTKGERPWLIDYRPARARKLRSKGFQMTIGERHLQLKPNLFQVSAQPVALDIGFVALKSFQVEIIHNWKKYVAPQGTLIMISGGLYEHQRFPKLPADRRWAVAWLALQLKQTAPRQIQCFGSAERPEIYYSAKDNNPGTGMSLGDIFNICGLSASEVAASREDLLWTKSACIVACDLVGLLLKKNYSELLKSEPAREMVRLTFAEILNVMRAQGRAWAIDQPEPETFLWKYLERGEEAPPLLLSDMLRKKQSEMVYLIEPILKAARRVKVKAPLLGMLYSMARAYTSTNGALKNKK